MRLIVPTDDASLLDCSTLHHRCDTGPQLEHAANQHMTNARVAADNSEFDLASTVLNKVITDDNFDALFDDHH